MLDKQIKILDKKVNIDDIKEFSAIWYFDFLKGTVDLENRKVAVGGDYHMESCEMLTGLGGKHVNIWGFNIRYLENGEKQIEYDSLVNIKPKINNGRVVQSEELRLEIEKLVLEFIDL